MGTRSILRRTGLVMAATAMAAAVAWPVAASAHVSIQESEQPAGSYGLLTFGVPHGCDGSPTTKVRIQIPEATPQVTPTENANWTVEKVMTALTDPVEAGHGTTLTERVSEVVYTAKTPLPDGYRDAFVLSLKLPDTPGETLRFPVLQICEQGETLWGDVPSAGQSEDDLELPAPGVALVAAESSATETAGTETAGTQTTVTQAAAGTPTTIEVAAISTDSSGDDATGLAIAGVAFGIIGIAIGGAALVIARRS
jgi:periplasmic copper chaperone A